MTPGDRSLPSLSTCSSYHLILDTPSILDASQRPDHLTASLPLSRLPPPDDPDQGTECFHMPLLPVTSDEEWQKVIGTQPLSDSLRRQRMVAFMMAKMSSGDPVLQGEGARWEAHESLPKSFRCLWNIADDAVTLNQQP